MGRESCRINAQDSWDCASGLLTVLHGLCFHWAQQSSDSRLVLGHKVLIHPHQKVSALAEASRFYCSTNSFNCPAAVGFVCPVLLWFPCVVLTCTGCQIGKLRPQNFGFKCWVQDLCFPMYHGTIECFGLEETLKISWFPCSSPGLLDGFQSQWHICPVCFLL